MTAHWSDELDGRPQGGSPRLRERTMDQAQQRLERKMEEWLEDEAGELTAAEFVSIVASVLADMLGSWARQEMRLERGVPDA